MIPSNTQAILLLTAHFTKSESSDVKPLTPKEWGRFAEWLWQQSLTPECLLRSDVTSLLSGWQDKTISIERLQALLDRGSALALAMEKWLRSGLWVMTRSDTDYPRRLKERLRGDSPAVLFGCGNRALLNSGGLAVVGSRKVKNDDLSYSRNLGALAASGGVSIVSGGAKGVDETAMLGALEVEGTAVGVLSDSLLRACSTRKYRDHLVANNLVLVSPFNPEAGFSAGNAMQRNKYIYCLADAALAVHSGKTGGTWNGAHENLKKGWVPLWVKITDDPEAGNADLINAGAHPAPNNVEQLDLVELFNGAEEPAQEERDLFEVKEPQVSTRESFANTDPEFGTDTAVSNEVQENSRLSRKDEKSGDIGSEVADLSQVTFYELFIAKVQVMCANEPRTTEQLSDAFGVNKTQLNAWLKTAVEDGRLEKLSKPVRYRIKEDTQGKLVLD